MSPITITSIGAAVLNYRKAKADYDALVEKQETLQAAVRAYNYSKLDEYNTKSTPDYSTEQMDGVMVNVIQRVGNLVGDHIRSRCSVVLTNTGSETYTIHKVTAETTVQDVYIFAGNKKQEIECDVTLRPGETTEIELPASISQLQNAKGEKHNEILRNIVCEACGKQLITSCPKISIEDVIKANIIIDYTDGADKRSWRIMGLQTGVLRYCGEAYFPK